MFRTWPRQWPGCLAETASQTPRTPSFATREKLHYLDQNEDFHDELETQEVYYNDEFEEWPEEEMDEIDFVGCDDAVEDAYTSTTWTAGR